MFKFFSKNQKRCVDLEETGGHIHFDSYLIQLVFG